ncbi:MAG: GGDEF domain-containing protein [Pseudomonadota bacterium]
MTIEKNVSHAAQAHDLIESIVQLTEQRDQRSLEHSLFTALGEVLEGCEGQMLLFSGNGDFKVLHATPRAHDLPDLILDRLAGLDNEPVQIRLGEFTFMLANLCVDQTQAKHGLVLWSRAWREEDARLAMGMVQVYRNFTRLLFDGEKDTLTGLFNRKRLERKLAELSSSRLHSRREADREGRGEYLALLDLDHFKRINDTHGHMIGDEVLIIFAGILQQSLRDADMCFRYGGEEFLVLLQDVTGTQAQTILERIRRSVADCAFPQVGQVTASIGYNAIDCRSRPPSQSIEEADRALYHAKENGRNQVAFYQALRDSGRLQAPQASGSIELFS